MPLFYHGAAAWVKMDYCCFRPSARCIFLHVQKSQKRCYNPSLSPPPYGGSCFSMLRQSVFVVWLVILFLLVHDEVNIQRCMPQIIKACLQSHRVAPGRGSLPLDDVCLSLLNMLYLQTLPFLQSGNREEVSDVDYLLNLLVAVIANVGGSLISKWLDNHHKKGK